MRRVLCRICGDFRDHSDKAHNFFPDFKSGERFVCVHCQGEGTLRKVSATVFESEREVRELSPFWMREDVSLDDSWTWNLSPDAPLEN